MKTAVIFGGMGFIGMHFATYLSSQNKFELIYLIDISEPKDKFGNTLYENLKINNRVKIIQKDIRKDLSDLQISKVDVIFDFAAIHREPGHADHEYFDTNVVGSKNICKFADQVNCRNIIFTSSISVYGPGDHEKNEDTNTLPNTAYGKSKLNAENNYLNWQNQNENQKILTICRPGVVFGPGENGNVTRLVKAIKRRLFFFMGNKYLKKSGIYIKELIYSIIWVNENQINNHFKKISLFNGTFHPCPNLNNYVTAISIQFKNTKEFISIPKTLIKLLIFFTSFFTKNLSSESNYNYARLNKLFRSNFVTPKFLLNSKYNFSYTLNSAMKDWKETNIEDWES